MLINAVWKTIAVCQAHFGFKKIRKSGGFLVNQSAKAMI